METGSSSVNAERLIRYNSWDAPAFVALPVNLEHVVGELFPESVGTWLFRFDSFNLALFNCQVFGLLKTVKIVNNTTI